MRMAGGAFHSNYAGGLIGLWRHSVGHMKLLKSASGTQGIIMLIFNMGTCQLLHF